MSDRSIAIKAAQTILASDHAVFLKVETTGISPTDEVVEIAIVHAATGEILLNTLVKPSFRYPMHDKLLHGITYDMLMNEDPITANYVDVILEGKQVIVFYKKFAEDHIRQSYVTQGKTFEPRCTWHCVMTLYGAFEGVMSDYGGGFKWWKFDDACENLHVNNTARNHRALEEAKSIGLLLYQIAASGDAVKMIKRDPLPRPVLDFDDMTEDEPMPYDQNSDYNFFHASSGFMPEKKKEDKPYTPKTYYADAYPDNEDEFDSYDDYGGDE